MECLTGTIVFAFDCERGESKVYVPPNTLCESVSGFNSFLDDYDNYDLSQLLCQ